MPDSKNTLVESNIHNFSIGSYGVDLISDTTLTSGKTWGAFQVLANAKFETLTQTANYFDATNSAANAQLADADVGNCIEIVAGTVIFGRFTEIKLWSGAILAYRIEEQPY